MNNATTTTTGAITTTVHRKYTQLIERTREGMYYVALVWLSDVLHKEPEKSE